MRGPQGPAIQRADAGQVRRDRRPHPGVEPTLADRPIRVEPRDDASRVAEGAVIPLAEEHLEVERRERVTGRVRVDVRTETFTETVSEELRSLTAEVERVPVGRMLEPGEAPPEMRTEGDVTIVPILEEVIVVETRLMLREELRVSRRESVETVSAEVPLRRQVAEVSRVPEEGAPDEPA